jgi:phosphoglycerate dehydrogenase-like enzyme
MNSGFQFTNDNLSNEPDIDVTVCRREDIAKEIVDASVVVPLMSRIDRDLISKSRRLKLIMQYGAGVEGIDLVAARDFGVPVASIKSSDSGNAQSCAEHAIFLALSLLRNTGAMKASLEEGRLGYPTGKTLFGSRVLIYGYGDLGQYLSHRLRAFEPSCVAAIGRREAPLPGVGTADVYGTTHKDFARLASDADIVFLTCAQSKENLGLVDASFINSLKRGCILVNIARGGLLNYTDVEAALISGHLGGLAIDVYKNEPFTYADSVRY